MPALCRDCITGFAGAGRCPNCRSPRVFRHPELWQLSIAHMDCDAFYASVEKRDNPDLRDKPLIVGGGKRGVVTTACYIARIKGVRSAMPMFQARKLCPEAEIVPPRMAVYVEVSKQIRAMMNDMTPIIEPLSLDEAFLDLTGTTRVHNEPPAAQMARLVKRIEDEIGITGSFGLSHNKFLAKIASDLDKPRGMSVIGKAETTDFLRGKPVGMIWGVGPAFRQTLGRDGIRTISDILRYDKDDLLKKYGDMGGRLWHLARGQDYRKINASAKMKSISKETTFNDDTGDATVLDGYIWRLAVQVSDRAKTKDLAGVVVTLKLKKSNFKQLSRRITLHAPTQLADTIYLNAARMLEKELPEGPFRLIGVGLSGICPADQADTSPDLLDVTAPKRSAAEAATDAIRKKYGDKAILKGRSLR
ncbi:MAG: DNA polymerase IV [Rhodobacteraceae bacterium]|nr:DNA polymerase IV [Paracoccaceae bacterium]